MRADVVHFHEACLSGYFARKGAPALETYDWDALREAAQSVCDEAKRRRIWALLGSAHRLTGRHKPTNCLYLIGPDGKVRDRYDKCFCTGGDLKFYTPGDRFMTFKINGVPCSTLICYDVRFPEMYRKLYQMGVRMLFQSFHNAYADKPNILAKVIRETMQGHAGVNNLFMSINNSNGYYSNWPSSFITPDGQIAAALRRNVAGIMVNTVDLKKVFYDAAGPYRDRAIRGVLHSGTPVKDPRISDRTCL